MEKYIDEKNPLDRLKLIKLSEKSVCADTISLLKSELNTDLVNDFAKERYNTLQNRKITPYEEEV